MHLTWLLQLPVPLPPRVWPLTRCSHRHAPQRISIGHTLPHDMRISTAGLSAELGQVVTYASDLALSTPSTIPAARLAVDRLLVAPPSTTHL